MDMENIEHLDKSRNVKKGAETAKKMNQRMYAKAASVMNCPTGVIKSVPKKSKSASGNSNTSRLKRKTGATAESLAPKAERQEMKQANNQDLTTVIENLTTKIKALRTDTGQDSVAVKKIIKQSAPEARKAALHRAKTPITFKRKAHGNEAGILAFNIKIASWNVADLRTWVKNDGLKFLEEENPDIFCLQELKCTARQKPKELAKLTNYRQYWWCGAGDCAGVGICTKLMPVEIKFGIDNVDYDDVPCILTAEFEKFFLLNVYAPFAGARGDKFFYDYLQRLEAKKPVIICGNMNTAHKDIDLAKPCFRQTFNREDGQKLSALLESGYVDAFRNQHPQQRGAYTFWPGSGKACARHLGWRLDYFLVSQRLFKHVADCCILQQFWASSDHCPITLLLKPITSK